MASSARIASSSTRSGGRFSLVRAGDGLADAAELRSCVLCWARSGRRHGAQNSQNSALYTLKTLEVSRSAQEPLLSKSSKPLRPLNTLKTSPRT